MYRKDHAAGYCTFSSELAETDEGWRLPTFYNIFVRLAYRKFGCARQLVTYFFRPHTVGKGRFRRMRRPRAGGKDGEMEAIEVEVPPGIDMELDFLDMLQIDPPVSAALTLCMEKIFSEAERGNIVCDSGKYEGGSLVFVIGEAFVCLIPLLVRSRVSLNPHPSCLCGPAFIRPAALYRVLSKANAFPPKHFLSDPCDPKTRVFKPNCSGYAPWPREKGQEVVIGGICKAEDVPRPDVQRQPPTSVSVAHANSFRANY